MCSYVYRQSNSPDKGNIYFQPWCPFFLPKTFEIANSSSYMPLVWALCSLLSFLRLGHHLLCRCFPDLPRRSVSTSAFEFSYRRFVRKSLDQSTICPSPPGSSSYSTRVLLCASKEIQFKAIDLMVTQGGSHQTGQVWASLSTQGKCRWRSFLTGDFHLPFAFLSQMANVKYNRGSARALSVLTSPLSPLSLN